MVKPEYENKGVRFLRSVQRWVWARRIRIAYLGGSYLFWVVSAPFLYKAIAECNGIERIGYQCVFVLSPISVPLMLVGYTVLSPVSVILGYSSAGEVVVEIVVAWILGAVAYGLALFGLWLSVKGMGSILKNLAESTMRQRGVGKDVVKRD